MIYLDRVLAADTTMALASAMGYQHAALKKAFDAHLRTYESLAPISEERHHPRRGAPFQMYRIGREHAELYVLMCKTTSETAPLKRQILERLKGPQAPRVSTPAPEALSLV